MKLLKIDAQGYFIEDIITDKIPTITETQIDAEGNPIEVQVSDPHYITTPCEGKFYKPKWNGTEWVEGMSQTEITTIQDNEQQAKQEREELKSRIENAPNRVDSLENENATLWYEKMMSDNKIKAAENEVASLWYELMMIGGA